MLEQSNVVRYLMDRSLLAPRAVVDGTVVVRNTSSRNSIFVVDAGESSSFVLKQGANPEGVAAVAREAAVYELLGRRGNRVTGHLPVMREYDAVGHVLILEKINGNRDLRAHQVRTGRFSKRLAASIGEALGAIHRDTAANVPPKLARPAPWVLSIHRPNLSIFRNASAAALELIRIMQSAPEFGERLDTLRAAWAPSCLVHHDVKWDNLIAPNIIASNTSRLRRLKVIDWEAAQFGDPRWDVGSIFSQYLSMWLFSIPITGRDAPEQFPALAKFPLERMQPAFNACWSAYRERAGIDRSRGAEWLQAAVSYAGARLAQTAFEAAQVAPHLDSSMVLHLQLASNILGRPREAVVHLLGIAIGQG